MTQEGMALEDLARRGAPSEQGAPFSLQRGEAVAVANRREIEPAA